MRWIRIVSTTENWKKWRSQVVFLLTGLLLLVRELLVVLAILPCFSPGVIIFVCLHLLNQKKSDKPCLFLTYSVFDRDHENRASINFNRPRWDNNLSLSQKGNCRFNTACVFWSSMHSWTLSLSLSSWSLFHTRFLNSIDDTVINPLAAELSRFDSKSLSLPQINNIGQPGWLETRSWSCCWWEAAWRKRTSRGRSASPLKSSLGRHPKASLLELISSRWRKET